MINAVINQQIQYCKVLTRQNKNMPETLRSSTLNNTTPIMQEEKNRSTAHTFFAVSVSTASLYRNNSF